jgi:hypothetical protein
MAADYFFFTDTNIEAQDAPGAVISAVAGAYGPVVPPGTAGMDEYRVTSLHSATFTPTAYAACDAIVCVQKVTADPTLVNVILKPLVQPALNFAPVKYIIYKGILASSLIDANGTDVAAPGNQLTIFLRDEQAKKNASVTPHTTAKAPANALGINLTGTNFADTDPIDNLFYRSGVTFQFPVVKGGWSIGQFAKARFGIEVLMEGLNFHHTLKLARQIESRISVPALAAGATDAKKFDHWHAKEQVLGFMDPCAFYGSFFRAGIKAKISTDTAFAPKPGNTLYQAVLSPFANRNTAYLDIRNEHNFSFNYFGNYLTTIMVGGATTPVDYYAGNWPLLRLTAGNFAAGNTAKARNAFALRLPVGDNPKPLVYVSQGYRDINRKRNDFPAELKSAEQFFAEFDTPAGGYTVSKKSSGPSSLTLAVPNVTGPAATTPVSCYIRLKYLKQQLQQGTPAVPTVIQSANYLDNLIWPIDLKIVLNSTAPIKSAVYDEDVYVNAQGVPGLNCDFVGKVGIARDSNNTYFFMAPVNVRTRDGQAAAQVSVSGETGDNPDGYPNVIAAKYPAMRVRKSDLTLLGTGTVNVAEFVSDADTASQASFDAPEFDTFMTIAVANKAYDSWKTKIEAAGAALDNRFRVYLGIESLFRGTDQNGTGYLSFELVLRGFTLDASAGHYKVSEMNTAP